MQPGKQAIADRCFFMFMAIAMALTVFAGFAPSYYLARPEAQPLAPHLLVHGAVMTGWMLLFVAQSGLVAAHRTDLHRRLGPLALVLATALVILTLQASLIARGWTNRIVFSIGAIVLFVGYFLAALLLRRHPDAHKRLMFLATLSLIPPAIARMGLPFVSHDAIGPNLASLYFLIPAVAFDAVTLRRIHPALLWGGLIMVLMLPLRWWLRTSVFA